LTREAGIEAASRVRAAFGGVDAEDKASFPGDFFTEAQILSISNVPE
jgi:hypothetical protein